MDSNIERTITEAFKSAADDFSDTVIFHYFDSEWKTVTYGELLRRVKSISSNLLAMGFNRGERVAIVSENRHEWCTAYLAIVMAGGTAVPIDSNVGAGEIGNLLHDSDARAVFHGQQTSESAKEALEILASQGLKQPVRINLAGEKFKSMIETGPAHEFPETRTDDIASIIYTSGTTGNPKGVMLSHDNFCSDAAAGLSVGLVSEKDNVLAVLPLHHTYAFMCTFLIPLFAGASITYPASIKGPDLMSAIKERGVSVLVGVPQLLTLINNGIMNKINALPKPLSGALSVIHGLSSVLRRSLDINIGRFVFKTAHKALGERFRFFASGGARLDPGVMKGLEALGFTVLEGYGLTETSPMVTFNPFSKRKPGSAGKAFPSAEIKINNPSVTGEGEIMIRGPMVMKGYYKNPSATADVIKDGWFMTGDIGKIDRDGYLFITGRSKEVIVLSSGKNIYPEEVEKLYMASPLIKEICVLGMDDKGGSDYLHAVIVPDLEYARQKSISDIQEGMKWAVSDISAGLASHMTIKGFTMHKDPLPRTPLGKLRRFMVKDSIIQQVKEKKREPSPESDLLKDETAKKVLEAVTQFAKGEQGISPDDNLELDTGLDSLTKIELVVTLEKTFSVKLPEDFMSDIQTVHELIEKMRIRKTGEKTSAVERTGWPEILSREPVEEDLKHIPLEKPGSTAVVTFVFFGLFKFLFRLLFRLEVQGTENIPEDRNCIIAPNHSSYLDGFVAGLSLPYTFFENLYTLGLSNYFTGFFKSWFASAANVIPIDTTAYLNKALQMSAFVLRRKKSMMVFPEGGRSLDGNLMEFKKGVGILAVEMGIPVVPVYIKGAFESLPRGAKWPRFNKITVSFGKPLRSSEVDFSKKREGIDEYQFFAEILKNKVGELKDAA
jgi:long-chain acyl-CoA synthetase